MIVLKSIRRSTFQKQNKSLEFELSISDPNENHAYI